MDKFYENVFYRHTLQYGQLVCKIFLVPEKKSKVML